MLKLLKNLMKISKLKDMFISEDIFDNNVRTIYEYIFYKNGNIESYCDYFGGIGLTLVSDKDMRWNYTPKDVQVFAGTGGESVHFGINKISGEINITVPCGNIKNLIVSKNFYDFISMGSKFGFFYFEQICYNYKDFLSLYDGNEEIELSEVEISLINEIKNIFGITKSIDNVNDYILRLNNANKEFIKSI